MLGHNRGKNDHPIILLHLCGEIASRLSSSYRNHSFQGNWEMEDRPLQRSRAGTAVPRQGQCVQVPGPILSSCTVQ